MARRNEPEHRQGGLMRLGVPAAAIVLCATGFAAQAPEGAAPNPAHWPRFHGPNGQNISPDTTLLRKWPEGGPRLLWTAEGIGHGFSGVTVAAGLIYTDGNVDGYTVITALDMNGRVRWRAKNGKAWTRLHAGSRGTPTIDGSRLYHESPLGDVVCLDAKTGRRIWGLNIVEKFEGKPQAWALAESLLVDGDRVICCPGGSRASMVALHAETGQTLWTAPGTGDKAAYASAISAEYRGLRMILIMTSMGLIGVKADTGELLFRFVHSPEHHANPVMPIYHDGHVFITSGYGVGSRLLKIDVEGSKASVRQVWHTEVLDNHHGGVVLLDGHLYGASHRGQWICLEWGSGRTMHTARGVGKGSLTCADGMLYVLSERGAVGLVGPAPSGHEVVSRFRLPRGGKGPSWAHPVVCGARLYIRHSDRLFAYDVRARGRATQINASLPSAAMCLCGCPLLVTGIVATLSWALILARFIELIVRLA